MKRTLYLIYGIAVYLFFNAVFLYLVGFLGDFIVPHTVDSGPDGAIGAAIAINLTLITLFGLSHSVMARPGFKKRWTAIIPHEIERSTYVLVASLMLVLLYALWRPIPDVIWDLSGTVATPVVWVLFALGWVVTVYSTRIIDNLDLFGVRQTVTAFRQHPYEPPRFMVRGLYRYVRHPLMLGLLMIFWITPIMTAGHLLLALGMTGYILVGTYFEERDLMRRFGDAYRHYRSHTPMLIPFLNFPAAEGPQTGRSQQPYTST